MKIEGRYQIPAPADRVYQALQDPDLLTKCIPGCERMEATGDDQYKATVKLGVAAITGTYVGSVAIVDKQPPERLTLAVQGSGAPGFVKGEGDAQVGGKIAAVGQRMLGGVARQLMNQFFNRLKSELSDS